MKEELRVLQLPQGQRPELEGVALAERDLAPAFVEVIGIVPRGTIERLQRMIVEPEDGVSARATGNPTDMAMSDDGRYLYARVGNQTSIAIYRAGKDGGLTPLPSLTGTPAGLAGLGGF